MKVLKLNLHNPYNDNSGNYYLAASIAPSRIDSFKKYVHRGTLHFFISQLSECFLKIIFSMQTNCTVEKYVQFKNNLVDSYFEILCIPLFKWKPSDPITAFFELHWNALHQRVFVLIESVSAVRLVQNWINSSTMSCFSFTSVVMKTVNLLRGVLGKWKAPFLPFSNIFAATCNIFLTELG